MQSTVTVKLGTNQETKFSTKHDCREPHLTYGSNSCYHFQGFSKLQKKAICIIVRLRLQFRVLQKSFQYLELLTLPSLYVIECTLLSIFKFVKLWRDTNAYEIRGRDNCQTGRHITVAHAYLPSEAGVRFINNLTNAIKYTLTPKASRTRSKPFKAFYGANGFLPYGWETNLSN